MNFAELADFDYVGPGGVVLRLVAALVCGLLIGIDREVKRKPVGLRTYALVSLGAAAYTIAILEMSFGYAPETDRSSTDPSRIFQGLVGALGFLGAGAVIGAEPGQRAQGMASAALIWLSGAVGIAAGMGLYFHAAVITVIAVGAVAAMEYAEYRLGYRDSLKGVETTRDDRSP